MSETNEVTKPAWVEAVDEAKTALRSAGMQTTPKSTQSKTQLAYAWMDVARLLKGPEANQ